MYYIIDSHVCSKYCFRVDGSYGEYILNSIDSGIITLYFSISKLAPFKSHITKVIIIAGMKVIYCDIIATKYVENCKKSENEELYKAYKVFTDAINEGYVLTCQIKTVQTVIIPEVERFISFEVMGDEPIIIPYDYNKEDGKRSNELLRHISELVKKREAKKYDVEVTRVALSNTPKTLDSLVYSKYHRYLQGPIKIPDYHTVKMCDVYTNTFPPEGNIETVSKSIIYPYMVVEVIESKVYR